MEVKALNIFYQEPDPDRWFKYDRYPRKIIRRIVRGKVVPSGQFLVYHNLIRGLDQLKIPYRINDYRYINDHPEEIACIIGKDEALFDREWENPIVFGAAMGINPVRNPDILEEFPIKKLVVPCKWLKQMFSPYGEDNIAVWPVGIDTDTWKPVIKEKKIDFLIYNKIRWDKEQMDKDLVEPIKEVLKSKQLSFTELKYGSYKPKDLMREVAQCRCAIFLCEHETQGIAYQQILSSGLPILAWDRAGYWQDPNWYPDKIKFSPVSSVPYWNNACGVKFTSAGNFSIRLNEFIMRAAENSFKPRDYILNNLTLAKCAQKYADIIASVKL